MNQFSKFQHFRNRFRIVCKIPLLAHALGLKAELAKRARDDRVSCIQDSELNFNFITHSRRRILIMASKNLATVYEKGPYEENICLRIYFS